MAVCANRRPGGRAWPMLAGEHGGLADGAELIDWSKPPVIVSIPREQLDQLDIRAVAIGDRVVHDVEVDGPATPQTRPKQHRWCAHPPWSRTSPSCGSTPTRWCAQCPASSQPSTVYRPHCQDFRLARRSNGCRASGAPIRSAPVAACRVTATATAATRAVARRSAVCACETADTSEARQQLLGEGVRAHAPAAAGAQQHCQPFAVGECTAALVEQALAGTLGLR